MKPKITIVLTRKGGGPISGPIYEIEINGVVKDYYAKVIDVLETVQREIE